MSEALSTRFQQRGFECAESRPEPCGIVIFGPLGDLTRRKLLPSLFHLLRRGLMPDDWFILGCLTRGEPLTDEAFREQVRLTLAADAARAPAGLLDDFVRRCFFQGGGAADPAFYRSLGARLDALGGPSGMGARRLFYLAVPPTLYEPIVTGLGKAGLGRLPKGHPGWNRVIIEKPFGRDLASAKALSQAVGDALDEEQVYRIDHYLGKETVQNILVLRFANTIFEPLWNRRYIDHVQITVAEALGVEHRGGYYEEAGCLRDMFQNHMVQMLTLVAMEPPARFEAGQYRDEKIKLLRSIRPFPDDPTALGGHVVRGQYTAGTAGGVEVPGYRAEPRVSADSSVETYAAMRVSIDNWRWKGVPFYLRSGKRLPRRISEIAITFRDVPHSMFSTFNDGAMPPNVLVLNVQPEEGISLTVEAKQPGPKTCMGSLTMRLDYRSVFGVEVPEAYERLLLDCMNGDQTLFVRTDALEAAWELLTPVLAAWEDTGNGPSRAPLRQYPAGSWGPAEADDLLRDDGRCWRTP
jgi:glucose-6-phosphate 1-dehydrogenase